MRTWFSLLFFMTLGMTQFGYSVEPLTVTEVRSEYVTMHGEDCVFQIDNEQDWREGDKAEAIVRDGKLIEVRYLWKR